MNTRSFELTGVQPNYDALPMIRRYAAQAEQNDVDMLIEDKEVGRLVSTSTQRLQYLLEQGNVHIELHAMDDELVETFTLYVQAHIRQLFHPISNGKTRKPAGTPENLHPIES